jgi:NhaP-type Na+/H+ or K+/H+ antiporter
LCPFLKVVIGGSLAGLAVGLIAGILTSLAKDAAFLASPALAASLPLLATGVTAGVVTAFLSRRLAQH